MNWANRNINYLLIVMIMLGPFAVMHGCEKQKQMEIARRGQ